MVHLIGISYTYFTAKNVYVKLQLDKQERKVEKGIKSPHDA